MSGRSNQQILQVQQATDIVRLIGEDIAIKPKGREFVTLCPFHDDSNPSMTIVPSKQIYHCFVCKAGGNVFGWMMNYHKMDFPEALRHLAERAGITLEPFRPGRDGDGGPSRDERQRILEANERAMRFFKAILNHPQHGAVGRQYVAERGISEEMIEQFQVGCAPDRWDGLVVYLHDKQWPIEAFERAGLVLKRDRGEGHFDRLRHRLIFPICDALGRPIAFGGRKMRAEDEPKYLNSPESPVFNKSATLFGLHLAKQAIIQSRQAVIVEGYTDVIACHQAGVKNVVATLGTALTSEHVSALKHYADKVVLIFDADAAGQMAADRALELFLAGSVDVTIATLPDENDPAELFAEPNGLERWHESVKQAQDALSYQFQRIRERIEASDTVTGREAMIGEYIQTLARLGFHHMGAIRKGLILQRLALLLRLPEAQIEALLRQAGAPRRRPVEVPASAPESSGDGSEGDVALEDSDPRISALAAAERNLIGCLLREPERFHQTLSDGRSFDEAITPSDFHSPAGRMLYEVIYQQLAEAQQITLSSVLADLLSETKHSLAQLAIEADAEVEARTGGVTEKIGDLVLSEAEALLSFQREREYRGHREAVNRTAESEDETALLLRRVAEFNRNNPKSTRIHRRSE